MSNEHANNHSSIIHSFFSSSLSRSLNLQTFHYGLSLIPCCPSLCALKGQILSLISECVDVSLCSLADTRLWHALGVQKASKFINVTVSLYLRTGFIDNYITACVLRYKLRSTD